MITTQRNGQSVHRRVLRATAPMDGPGQRQCGCRQKKKKTKNGILVTTRDPQAPYRCRVKQNNVSRAILSKLAPRVRPGRSGPTRLHLQPNLNVGPDLIACVVMARFSLSLLCRCPHVWISCWIEQGREEGRRGGIGACVFRLVCVCGVRGWLPACLCGRLVYRGGARLPWFFFWCLSKSTNDTHTQTHIRSS